MADEHEVVDLAQSLVHLNTVNPPGHERDAAVLCRSFLEQLGFACSLDRVSADRCSLVGLRPGALGTDAALVINGHLDTVPAGSEGWTVDPHGAELRADRLFGRGAADMKGGLAAALCAVRDCVRRQVELPDLVLHLVADEEAGGALGTARVVRTLTKRRFLGAIVPEPTDLAISIAERGALFVAVDIHGESAHGSAPGTGRSAILDASHVAQALSVAEMRGLSPHPLLGRPSCSVGQISGGMAPNVVPDSCRLIVDRRLVPGETESSALASLRSLVARSPAYSAEVTMETLMFAEPSESPPDAPFVELARQCHRESFSADAAVTGMRYSTDARFLRNDAGIDSIVIGPGEVAQMHTPDESVGVHQLLAAQHFYSRVLERARELV